MATERHHGSHPKSHVKPNVAVNPKGPEMYEPASKIPPERAVMPANPNPSLGIVAGPGADTQASQAPPPHPVGYAGKPLPVFNAKPTMEDGENGDGDCLCDEEGRKLQIKLGL